MKRAYASLRVAGWRPIARDVWQHRDHGTLVREQRPPRLWVHMPRRGWVGGVYDSADDALRALQAPGDAVTDVAPTTRARRQ